MFNIPSQHSGFRSEDSDADDAEIEEPTQARWSPPGSHQPESPEGSGWYRHQPYQRKGNSNTDRMRLMPTVGLGISPSQSREPSPQYEDALEGPANTRPSDRATPGDTSDAANVPLPAGADTPLHGRSPSPPPRPSAGDASRVSPEDDRDGFGPEIFSNFAWCTKHGFVFANTDIRFAVRAEVQQREPIAAVFGFLRSKFERMTSSKSHTTLSIIVLLLAISFMRALVLPGLPQSIPDLVKLSGFARSFEPLIYYSENGVQQIGTLQETGVAVWDLSESVRGTNMTSAPIIVGQLDELSDSLKSLSLELTRFFANVDSDIDSILIVMDWAKRELETLSNQPPSSLPTIVFDNLHDMLSRIGALESSASNSDGAPTTITTPLGHLVMAIFGPTSAQRTRTTLTRTFTEFLSVLEESINSELTHSTALFALFESIDRQFLNLQRTVVRESDAQERAEGEMLSSLWTRVLGPDAAAVRKYEKNRKLLANVRSRTVANKHLLVDHRGRLLTLKVNLETLRRKLVSPLVRRNDSVSFVGSLDGGNGNGNSGSSGRMLGPVEAVIDGQIRGLEGTYDYLRSVREKQKAKLLEMVYGAGRKVNRPMIDGLEGRIKKLRFGVLNLSLLSGIASCPFGGIGAFGLLLLSSWDLEFGHVSRASVADSW
ncbi:uncharacterized protein N7515_005434 [Penicillium bovifimosum]|uniref:Uncharacterized protein n=1 Tax=Penicillium bovifimosum TaxID=126998 RepID=A0A9W9L049_9EURO|nr:uncharacterized protein N7515_005434 [Penicillium bovifimosum]KAJ5129395.1 hypothetical protein N7515_005434 [Penicillium bovifimosum]